MVQTTDSTVPRRTAGHATAVVLLGAGLACAGNAHAGMEAMAAEPAELAGNADTTPAVAIPTAIDMAAMPAATELPALASTPVPVSIPAPAEVPPVAVEVPAVRHPAKAADAIVAVRAGKTAEVPVVAVVPVVPVVPPAAKADKVVAPVAEAPARVVPVDRASVTRHHPNEDPLGAAMTLARRDPDEGVAAARKDMAQWKPVAQARLDESRGGFSAGGLQVGLGIDRAVFVNGALAVSTSITIPDISNITSAQAAQLAQALGQVTVAVTAANSAANAAVAAAQAAAATAQGAAAAAQGAAGQAGQSATAAAQGAATTAQGAAGTATATATSAAAGASALASGAMGAAQQAVANATGTVVTNGLMAVIQNGAGNIANVGALSNMPGTVIQNSLNNQNIQSLMTLNASVNTLAAFRAQMANTALNSIIQRSAAAR